MTTCVCCVRLVMPFKSNSPVDRVAGYLAVCHLSIEARTVFYWDRQPRLQSMVQIIVLAKNKDISVEQCARNLVQVGTEMRQTSSYEI